MTKEDLETGRDANGAANGAADGGIDEVGIEFLNEFVHQHAGAAGIHDVDHPHPAKQKPDAEKKRIGKHRRMHTHGEVPELDQLLENNPLVEDAILKMRAKYDGGIDSSGKVYDALEISGSQAYGIVGIEIWKVRKGDGKLYQPDGGMWTSPMLPESDALKRLTDKDHPRYIPAEPEFPGYGLAGVLWAEAKQPNMFRQHQDKSPRQFQPGLTQRHSHMAIDGELEEMIQLIQHKYHYHGRTMQWRDIHSLVIDPDTPKSHRMEALIDAGLGQVAAISFSQDGVKGMVLYYARATANRAILMAAENQEFMFRKAKQLGCLVSMFTAAKALKVSKDRATKAAWKQFVHNLLEHKRRLDHPEEEQNNDDTQRIKRPTFFSELSTFDTGTIHKTTTKIWKSSRTRCGKLPAKWRGGNAQLPPAMSTKQTLWTFMGCFLTLTMISAVNEQLIDYTDGKYTLGAMGPYGALVALLYGLHSAPSSQPRNVFYGQIVAGGLAMLSNYFPEWLPRWIRVAIGPSLGIAAMTRLGVLHPPAAANAVTYVSRGRVDWPGYGIVVACTAVAVLPAILINNLSHRRQYPIYWGQVPTFLARKKN